METKNIKSIIALFEASECSAMELEVEGMRIKLEKAVAMTNVVTQVAQPTVVTPQVVTPTPVNEVTEELDAYVSPLVGTFYRSASVGGKPYVEVGRHVKKGDVIAIVEAMKVMNEIKADKEGIVKEILVNDGEMVQYDQRMMTIVTAA